MFENLSNKNLVKTFIGFVILFSLSGCECIKPEDSSGLREKLDIVSTEQKWVDSGVYISDEIKVTEINIVLDRVNFCSQYEDFAIEPGVRDVRLPFALKAGDSISFSVVGSKMCKSDNGTVIHKKIDESCDKGEVKYFAHVLNQNECQSIWKNGEYRYKVCPNKLMISNGEWLSGQEYWSLDFFEQDQEEKIKEIRRNINLIKQGENMDCSKLSSIKKNKMDTYVLNFACQNMCYYFGQNCVEIESNIVDFGNTLVIDKGKASEITKVVKTIAEKREIKTYIPFLVVSMEKEELEYDSGGNIRTNHDYEIKNNHSQGDKLTFIFNIEGNGGFNMRVTKNHAQKNNLYISVSDKFPEHNPGETQGDIAVDISKVYNTQYMEGLVEKLKSKSGIIYYGIRDRGCDYKKNEGQFRINLITKEPPARTFSAIYNFFDEKVKTAFFGSRYKDTNEIYSDTSPLKSLYQSFTASNRTNTIRSTIVSLLVLYVVLYTLYYFFGLSYASIYEFLIICVKIVVITQLLNDNSWNFFYNDTFSIFVNTPKKLIEIINFRGTTSNVFEFLDLSLNRFLSLHSVSLIVSLIFSGPLGIVLFCLMIWGLITVSLSMFNVLFSFITSIAIVALLLSLSPLFIICLLFGYTRQMFHNWVKNLARFAIHPVVLLIFMSLISQIMDYIVYSVLNFEVCPTCILNLNLKIFSPCIIYGYAPKNAPNIAAMMAFVIFGHAMKALVEASSAISDSLFGIYVANEPGKQYQQSLIGMVGLDEQSVQRRAGMEFGTSSQKPQIPQSSQRSAPKILTNIGNQ